MYTWLASNVLGRVGHGRHIGLAAPRPGWRTLPMAAQLYVAGVVAGGGITLVAFWPRAYPQPVVFALLLAAACLTSTWKVNLPMSVTNGATLSVRTPQT